MSLAHRIIARVLAHQAAVAAAAAEGAANDTLAPIVIPPLQLSRGRPRYMPRADVSALIQARDRSQTSITVANFPGFIQEQKQAAQNKLNMNQEAIAPPPSLSTAWRLRQLIAPETASAQRPTPTRVRALLAPLNCQSIAAAVGTLRNINSHCMFNMDTTNVQVGNLMNERPLVVLAVS